MPNVKILLHTCCAPCSIYPFEYLAEKGVDICGYFYNPNIHPYTELQKRKEALEQYAVDRNLTMIFDHEYYLEDFIRAVACRENERCRVCYAMRLDQVARVAKEGGFDCFSTTLLVSPYQRHELIKETGMAAAERHGVPFYYADYRPGFREATARSRELGMYRQKYCGCIYSEKERYNRREKKG